MGKNGRIDVSSREWDRFYALRKDLHKALTGVIELGAPGKSWEGEMSIAVHFPGVYDLPTDKPDEVCIHADVYLIGPHRHYDWCGSTFSKALDKAEADIRGWIELEGGAAP